jgi:MOSC domain-containing protein YiiM
MRVASVNVGLPREVEWKNMTVRTGIFKEPVSGRVVVRHLNLDGDGQADLTVHGGADKAVYAYPDEHYPFWREQLPDIDFAPGRFGENLTIEGLAENTLYIGDQLQVGSAVLMVTQPRMPCYKLALRIGRDDIIKRFLESRRSGFYFSVVEEGEVEAGSEMQLISQDPNKVTVTDIVDLYHNPVDDPGLLQRALNTDALPVSWRDYLRRRADALQQRKASTAR